MGQTKKGLGRGLEALLGDMESPFAETEGGEELRDVKEISLDLIKVNKSQPRKTFDKEKIEELAVSIKEHGVIQPILVRKAGKGFEIVAGERRWRASREAGLKKIPAIVREISDRENMIFAIIENLQREGLNPVEEAEGFREMMEQYNLTQEEVSKSVGKSRPYITNQLRLLKLPKEIRKMLIEGKLSTGHAKVLITISEPDRQIVLAEEVISKGLSVRALERMTKEKSEKDGTKKASPSKSPEAKLLERELESKLGTKTEITENGNNGKIEIKYFSLEDRDRIVELMMKIK